MRVREQANGLAYTEGPTTIVFPFGGGTPYLVWHDQVVRLTDPERFGPYQTAPERRHFMLAFTASIDRASPSAA